MSNHSIELERTVAGTQQDSMTANGMRPPKRAGVLLVASTVLVSLLHALLAWAFVAHRQDPSYALGQVFGYALFAPLVVVALFQLHPRFRNERSYVRIFLWTSVCSIVSIISKVASTAAM